MKKKISLLLAICAVTSLSACTRNPEPMVTDTSMTTSGSTGSSDTGGSDVTAPGMNSTSTASGTSTAPVAPGSANGVPTAPGTMNGAGHPANSPSGPAPGNSR